MNLENKKKNELIDIIESQKHLASAVDAKDSEIIALKKENEELKTLVKTQEHLASAVDAKDFEISNLKKENKAYRDVVDGKAQAMKTELEKQVEDLTIKLNNSVPLSVAEPLRDLALNYRTAHQDLMKLLKVAMDMSLGVSELLDQKLKEVK